MSLPSAPVVHSKAALYEKWYRRLFTDAHEGILMLDSESGRITDANPFLHELLGYPPDTLLGKKLWEIGIFENRETNRAAFQRLLEAGSLHFDDLTIRTQRGERRVVEFVGSIYTEGVTRVIQCHIRDITERKQRENERQEAELFADAALNGLTAEIAVLDADGIILACNEAWNRFAAENATVRVIGTVGKGANYLAVCDAVTGDDSREAHRVAAGIRAVIAGEQELFTLEYPCHTPKRQHWFILRVTPLFGEGRGRVVVSHEDVTVRKQMEERERTRLIEIFEQAPAFMAVLRGPQHVFDVVNPSYYQLVGHRDILGKPVVLAVPEVVEQGYIDLLDQVYQTGETFVGREMSLLVQRVPDGPLEERFIDFTYQPIRDSDGSVSGIIAHGIDSTERKRAEEALRRERGLLRSQTESSPEGILTVSSSGEVISYNQRFMELWQFDSEVPQTESEILRFAMEKVTSPSECLAHVRHLQAHPSESSYDLITLKNGRFFERYSAPAKGEEGTLYGRIWFFRDVTAQEELKATLRASEERFRALTENSSDIVTILSLDGTVLYESPSLTPIVGYLPEELVGTNAMDLVHPEDLPRVVKAMTDVAMGRVAPHLVVYRYKHKDGSWRWLESIGSSQIDNQAIGGFVTNSRDVTERVRLQEQMVRSERLAAMGELVAGVVHEINNPLSAISGHAQLMQYHPDPQVKEDGNNILLMTERISRIIRALLSLSRQVQASDRSPAQLRPLIEEVLQVIHFRLRGSEVEVALDLAEPDLSPVMNSGQIEQVLLNLLGNAEYALREQGANYAGRRILITTRQEIMEGRDWAILSVSDNGTGIPDEVKGQIFNPFFTTKPQGEGTGLGLSICHGIMEEHEGRLEVVSEVGVGTTFTLSLPLLS